jgi:hypothetical protein
MMEDTKMILRALRARDDARDRIKAEYDHDGLSWEAVVAWYEACLDVMIAKRASQIEHGYPEASIREMDKLVAESRESLKWMKAEAAREGGCFVPFSLADTLAELAELAR